MIYDIRDGFNFSVVHEEMNVMCSVLIKNDALFGVTKYELTFSCTFKNEIHFFNQGG